MYGNMQSVKGMGKFVFLKLDISSQSSTSLNGKNSTQHTKNSPSKIQGVVGIVIPSNPEGDVTFHSKGFTTNDFSYLKLFYIANHWDQ